MENVIAYRSKQSGGSRIRLTPITELRSFSSMPEPTHRRMNTRLEI